MKRLTVRRKLADTPSEIIKWSLEDLLAVEVDPDYVYSTNARHVAINPPVRKQVSVDLVGCALAKRFGIHKTVTVLGNLSNFVTPAAVRYLRAVEFASIGLSWSMMKALDKPTGMSEEAWTAKYGVIVPTYERDPDQFSAALRLLADKLRQGGF